MSGMGARVGQVEGGPFLLDLKVKGAPDGPGGCPRNLAIS